MYKSILIPVDGSELSYTALDQARGLGGALAAKLTVAIVNEDYPTVIAGDGYIMAPVSPQQWQASIDARNARIANEVSKRLDGAAHEFVSISAQQVYEGILLIAKKYQCDLIVMASHGRRGFAALLMGSETTKVLTHSRLPVLVCR